MATSDFLNLALRNQQYLPPEIQAQLAALSPAGPGNEVGLPTDAALPDTSAQTAPPISSLDTPKDLNAAGAIASAGSTFQHQQDADAQDALATAKLQAAQTGVPGAQFATSPADLSAARATTTVARPSLAPPSLQPFQSLALAAPGLDGSPPPTQALAAAPTDASGPLGAVSKMVAGAATSPGQSSAQSAAQAVQSAPNAVDALPSAPPAKPPPPSGDAELEQAQQASNKQADLMGALGLVNEAESKFAGNAPSDFYKQQVARANVPVDQLLQRRAAAAQQAQAAQQASERDPSSPRSRAFQKVMGPMLPKGTPPDVVAQMSIADFNEGGIGKALVAARERADALVQAKEKSDAESKREAGKDAEVTRHNKAEEALKAQEIGAKEAKSEKLKPLPAEINQKISGAATGAEGLNKVWDKFDSVGPLEGAAADLPLVPTSRNAREYGDLLNTSAKEIAPAESPNARENPAAQAALAEHLPHPSDSKPRAAQNVMNHFGAIESRLQSELEANRGQYDTSGIERELNKVRAEKTKFIRKAAKHLGLPAGAAPSPAPSGAPAAPSRITRTDPTTGETRAWDGNAWVKV